MRSAILFDLDHFGRVNKQYGHQVGDRVLRPLRGHAAGPARGPSDLVARYGGEEFVVILDNASREDAARIAETVRTAFAKQTVDTRDRRRTSRPRSRRAARPSRRGRSRPRILLERADVALAMAKAAGRDKVVAA